MILVVLIAALALASLTYTAIALPRDGYRQIPTDPSRLPPPRSDGPVPTRRRRLGRR